MIHKNKSTRNFLILALFTAAMLISVSVFRVAPDIRRGLLFGCSLAAFNGLLAYGLLAYTIDKSSRIFYGAFFGSMIWKLVVLLVVFAALRSHPVAHIPSTLLSMAVLTIVFNLLEVSLLPTPLVKTHGF